MDTLSVRIGVSICIVCIQVGASYARVGEEYRRWSRGEFEIPADIAASTTSEALRPFLNSTDEFKRMAAVRRLGQIEGEKGIDLLLDVFTKEPPAKGIHMVPLVKKEVVRTLGRIDADKSKSALIAVLNKCWQVGPGVPDKKYFYRDNDFACVVPLLLQTLQRWSGDLTVRRTSQELALSNDVKEYYGASTVGQMAWELYLKGRMHDNGIVGDERDELLYLLNLMEEGFSLQRGGNEQLGLVQVAAARHLLQQYGSSSLMSVRDHLNARFQQEPLRPDGRFTEEHAKIRRAKGQISRILKERESPPEAPKVLP